MKRILLLSFLLLGLITSAWAQRTVSGKVTDAASGIGLPGVAVKVKNTGQGTVTDIDGNYKLEVPSDNAVLVFSFVGYTTQETQVGNRATINVTLGEDVETLGEVVVTALGITRNERSLGYSVQKVNGEDLAAAKETNIVNSLAGKVAGVQITGSPSMGGSSRILLRGANSLQGENQPLFVVDGVPIDNSNFASTNTARGAGGYDYGNAAQDINPEDIETISVLKGGAAAALYGSRAANGAIIITTKKGTKKKGIGVTVNSNLTFEDILVLPDYQNMYGGGFDFDDHEGQRVVQYAVDESWGPKFEGQQVRHWDSWDDWDVANFGKTRPWVANPNNIRDFFELGRTFSNNIALSGGNDIASFRLSYTNLDQSGIFPNSNLERNTVNFNGSTKLTEKFSTSLAVNYINSEALGRPGTGYDGNNVMQQFNQWGQRQVDMNRLRNYKNPDGSQRTWNRISATNPFPKYTDNPYWVRFENFQNDRRERFFGNLAGTYEFTNSLKLTGRLMTDYYNDRRQERIAVGSQAESFYQEELFEVTERVADLIMNYNKDWDGVFSLNAFVGMDTRKRIMNENTGQTVGGLSTPNFYSLENAVVKAEVTDRTFELQTNGVFATASVGYKSTLFVDLTARNDWSSTLPPANNSYFYPSVATSFVFTELPVFANSNVLSFGKLRAGWAKVGNATDPYRLYRNYLVAENVGSNPANSVPNVKPNPNLLPESTYTYEAGTSLKFLNNRIGLDATYYFNRSVNQIVQLPLSATTGYSHTIINAGEMQNQGVELMLFATPVKAGDFSWDVTANWSRNRNKVVDLIEGIDNLRLGTAPFAVTVNAFKGQPYGTILGTNFVYHENGQRLVEDGVYVASDDLQPLGSVLADYTGGVQNTFTYKNIGFSALVDFQKGGSLFSTTNMWGKYSGILAETAANNIREEGIIVPGVNADGSPNTTVIDANSHFFYHGGYVIAAADVYDASFVKLREMRLSYSLPTRLFTRLPFTHVRVSAVGRNLAILHKNVPHIDPEVATSAGNVQGLEGGALPSTRSFGVSLSLGI